MKILSVIPLWKRPEVWEIAARNLRRFQYAVSWNFDVLTIISPEDPEIKALERVTKRNRFDCCYYPNYPVGRKLNAGINYAMERYYFDYLMNFGSDDLIHPDIEPLYRPFFDEKVPIFGVDSLYFYELSTGKTMFFKCYDDNLAVGAGRMISRDVLEILETKDVPLYTDDLNRSLDSDSARNIEVWAGIQNKIIKVSDFPYIIDIKTLTNINHISMIEHRTTQITYKDKVIITENFEL